MSSAVVCLYAVKSSATTRKLWIDSTRLKEGTRFKLADNVSEVWTVQSIEARMPRRVVLDKIHKISSILE